MRTLSILVGCCLSSAVALAQQPEPTRLLASAYRPERLEEAVTTLRAANVVAQTAEVEYKAGQSVVLEPGFETKAGAVFTAHTGEVSLVATVNAEFKSLSVSVYPNPVDEVTIISYILPKSSRVSLAITSADGKLLSQLVSDVYQEAGAHQVEWKGSQLAAGTYVCTFDADSKREAKRIIKK